MTIFATSHPILNALNNTIPIPAIVTPTMRKGARRPRLNEMGVMERNMKRDWKSAERMPTGMRTSRSGRRRRVRRKLRRGYLRAVGRVEWEAVRWWRHFGLAMALVIVAWCSGDERRLVVKTSLALKGGARFDSAVGGENNG
jgi:hypothetical protein